MNLVYPMYIKQFLISLVMTLTKCLRLITIIVITVNIGYSQEQDQDTLAQQTVNVMKPYTPTISDAFKIQLNPQLGASDSLKKKKVVYNIFSIPVASTFTPAKGKAASVERSKPKPSYNNYASFGLGNYTNILGDVYLNHELNNGALVGGYLGHHSSQGGIDDLVLEDGFSKTNLDVFYKETQNDYEWKINGGLDLRTFNWYGLPQELYADNVAEAIDPQHNFTGFNLGGELQFYDEFLEDISVRFKHFSDNYNASENRYTAGTNFKFHVNRETITTTLFLDGLSGEFGQSYLGSENIRYKNFIVGASPSYQLNQDDLTVNLGLSLVYFNASELNESKFYVYPNIEATYKVVSDVVKAYAGVTGELRQNSYQEFTEANPFVSPTLNIRPTDQPYKGFLGLKGKLSQNVTYDLNGSYTKENNKPLFKAHNALSFATENYQYGNAFNVVYDDVTTFGLAGSLQFDLNRNFTLKLNGEYFSYDTSNQQEAWNLPNLTASLFLDYQISETWYAGATAYFVGERKDHQVLQFPMQTEDDLNILSEDVITLDSFFDANAYVGYRVNEQFSVFAKVNNIANQDYQRFLNFPVQGLQFLAGANYQFDF